MADLSINAELMSTFAFYAIAVIVKMMIMSLVTAVYRFSNKAFINPEDCRSVDSKLRPKENDNVERVRRVHRNDLENVLPFILIGFLYVFTNPDFTSAVWHFRVFVASRFMHTFVYLTAVRQPARPFFFFIGIFTMASMAYRVLSTSAY